jgi:hypothetical protein
MTYTSITDETLEKAYITALLLTGNAEEAEAAVFEGIQATEHGDASPDALLHETMAASITGNSRPSIEEGDAASRLPAELRRVLRLPRDLRRCFVLRVLAGLPNEICARMLRIEIHRVDELVSASAQALANLSVLAPRMGFAAASSRN